MFKNCELNLRNILEMASLNVSVAVFLLRLEDMDAQVQWRQQKQSSACSGLDDGNAGAHPSNIWTKGTAESTQMLHSVDLVPTHATQRQSAIESGGGAQLRPCHFILPVVMKDATLC